MRIFVTGGAGFIGSAVVRSLVQRRHDVVCLVRKTTNLDAIADLDVELSFGDVRDRASILAGMDGCDATIHLAAPGGWDANNRASLFEIIESGTRNVLDVARQQPRHRLIFVSSTAAINGSDRPIVFDETSAFSLSTTNLWYAIAKHRAEELTRAAAASGLDAVIVNPAEVYGPGDVQLGTAGNLIDFATSKPVLICDGGTSVVHVYDVANGTIAALERGRSGERYILGGDNLSVRELAELTLACVGRNASIVSIPRSIARGAAAMAAAFHVPLPFNPHVVPYATRYWFMDSTKARTELGVTFRSARETIGDTIRWLRETGTLR